MLILQAGFENEQLLVWGESPCLSRSSAVPATNRGNGRKTKALANNATLSPWDAGTERLLAAVEQELPGLSPSDVGRVKVAPGPRLAWLPTWQDWPVPSTPLLAQPPPPAATVKLAAWTVHVQPLSCEQAVQFLCGCINRDTLQPGVIVGKSLAFWAQALRFAGSLVAREQFLPDLTNEPNESFRARWQPVYLGTDRQKLSRLAQAMPAACRALSPSDVGRGASEEAPDLPASRLLTAFLDSMVDTLVRSSVAPDEAAVLLTRKSRKPAAGFESIHDQWLHGLRASSGALQVAVADAKKLGEQVEDWRRPVLVSTAAPFRLCFRLEEPEEETEQRAEAVESRGADAATLARQKTRSAPWHLRYLLQAADDPSLLVPATEAWTARGRKSDIFKRASFDVREYLLSSLGQAAGLCPAIETSLKTASPPGMDLDAQGAYSFLAEKSWLLEQAGFGVFLPAWWSRKGTKVRLSARAVVKSPKMQGGSGLSLDEIVTFDWQVALGDEVLTREELELLAKLKAPLVKVRGQWVQLTSAEIKAALDFWKKKSTTSTTQASVRDIVHMALGGAKTPGDLAFAGVTASGWIKDFLSQLEDRSGFELFPAPEGFHGELRPYQVRGYSWLGFLRRWGLGACLADDMGLGKTVQALALIRRDWQADSERPTLLACPMSVVGNWHKEAARFTPDLPVLVHHGLDRKKGPEFRREVEKSALVLTSYALLHRDFDLFQEVPWAGVILDEAQNIKNPETKQARAARALKADYRMALTGTPVENHVGDLWSIMEFLNPGFLGSQAEFKRSFFVPIQAGQDPEATRRLQRLTSPFVLRRLKTDKSIIADLPDKLEMKVFCTLTKEQASLYQAVVEEASKSLQDTGDGIQRKGVILATLSKLKQVCNHPAQFLGDNSSLPDRSGKLARLTEMLEEIHEIGDRALVFSQFSEMGELLKRHLEETFGREVLFLHGGTTKKQRDHMVERFQKQAELPVTDGPRVFLLSLKAGGTGLNLTAANHVFHFDRWWNPAVENQATDRAFRIGQTRNVQVHKFLCVGTLEEKIDEMIERKQEIAKKVVGTGEGWLTEMSNEQLKELFALRGEALGE